MLHTNSNDEFRIVTKVRQRRADASVRIYHTRVPRGRERDAGRMCTHSATGVTRVCICISKLPHKQRDCEQYAWESRCWCTSGVGLYTAYAAAERRIAPAASRPQVSPHCWRSPFGYGSLTTHYFRIGGNISDAFYNGDKPRLFSLPSRPPPHHRIVGFNCGSA